MGSTRSMSPDQLYERGLITDLELAEMKARRTAPLSRAQQMLRDEGRCAMVSPHGTTCTLPLTHIGAHSNVSESWASFLMPKDPLGPEGVYGFGRCARCGESFRPDADKAEVCGDRSDPDALILDPLIIHADCVQEGDVQA